MERSGTGRLFMEFALSLTGTRAVRARWHCELRLFGTVSGSAVANVMDDGPMTIPLMQRSGYSEHSPARSKRPLRPAGRSCRG